MSIFDWALEAPVTSLASILFTVLFGGLSDVLLFNDLKHFLTRTQLFCPQACGVIGGNTFVEKAYLVLSDTVGEKFYIWYANGI